MGDCMCGRMDGWRDVRMDGWVGGWMDVWMGGWMDGWMDGWNVDRWIRGWMDGRVDGWAGGWADVRFKGWTSGCVDGMIARRRPPFPSGPTAILVAACWVVWSNDNFQRKSRGVCCVGRRGSFDEVQSVRGMALRTRDPWSEAAAEPLRGPMQGPALRGLLPTTFTHICKTYLTRFPLLKKLNRAATPSEPAIIYFFF